MEQSNPYSAPFFLFNAHLETIYPALFRRVDGKPYERERLELADGDFLDLDWLRQGSDRLVIIQHGLEGNSTRGYIKGMARIFFQHQFDVLAWNYRGCSEEMNRLLRFYHSGATEDLDSVIQHALSKNYSEVFLIGFSLGGNMTLKYLGERIVSEKVKKAAVFSVPLHLESSCRKISQFSNRIYANRFLKSLKHKITAKAKLQHELDTSHLSVIRSLIDFDNAYTAPLHGFKDAHDYYERCSALFFLDRITRPTLIVNTLNDPFLTKECFPVDQLKTQSHVKIEVHARGGHVGFSQFNGQGIYWSEQRALDWITSASH